MSLKTEGLLQALSAKRNEVDSSHVLYAYLYLPGIHEADSLRLPFSLNCCSV